MENAIQSKPVVLVTAIGTTTATAIVCELKRTGSYYIIGADINTADEVATSIDVDEFYKFPSAVKDLEGYINFAVDFCRQHKVDFYYAVIDEEVVNLSENKDRFEEIGVKLCIANQDLVRICHYKNNFSKWIEEHLPEIAVRSFDSFETLDDSDFPVFIKPVEGRASAGCVKVINRAQLEGLACEEDIGKNIVVQEFLEGRIVTVDLVRNAETKQSMQIQREELLRNANGCGIAVEIINHGRLHEICEKLMEHLDLNGVINAEFFLNGEEIKIIEINPRFSAGTSFSCMAGGNTVINALRIADGQECRFNTIKYGKRFAKRYETYAMN